VCGKKLQGPTLAYLRGRRLGAQYTFCCGLRYRYRFWPPTGGEEKAGGVLGVRKILGRKGFERLKVLKG
jgi:hypothetical protein